MTLSAKEIKAELMKLADRERASVYALFFKTGTDQYGEGDVFAGVTVPKQRVIAKRHAVKFIDSLLQKDGKGLGKILPGSFSWIQELLNDKVHECRLTALMIMVYLYKHKKSDAKLKVPLYKLYVANFKNINNWDLVDTSARDIVGAHLHEFMPEQAAGTLSAWAASKYLWTRRVSIVATHYFIGKGEFAHTSAISEALLGDRHDLIHKASGWMLREMGKKNEAALLDFLGKNGPRMPRTMLRYAIERLSPEKRRCFMEAPSESRMRPLRKLQP
ncbi:MAG TPA: DNA alkylation repair protein [Candidatus Paceibacterota bacterium]